MSNKTLALLGGEPIVSEPLPAWPSLDKSVLGDIENILETGEINYWTGNRGRQFEADLESYLGDGHVITTTNGTSALQTAFTSLGISDGDEIICQPYTFIASAFSIMQAGAKPVFADVDESHTLDASKLERHITPKTKAILVVHTFGVPSDMDAINAIAKAHNLLVIEDCAQALGSQYDGQLLGTVSDAGCFSFCQSKHITTGGEGGAIFVGSEDLAWKCRSFRDHGFDVEKRLHLFELEQKLPYIHVRLGFNFRMTEIQSAIGIKELAKFNSGNLEQRIKNGKRLTALLEEHPLVSHLPIDDEKRVNSYWWAPYILDMSLLDCDIKTFANAMAAEGVPAYPVPWPEIYKEQAFANMEGSPSLEEWQADCPMAKTLGETTLVFHTHPVYDEHLMEAFYAAFNKVYEHYKK
ncbi:DegT/DnrJ/EryC1/StrS family aminotransferase [Vibrio penaeicida]|uniref:DegT/DnrJ/EryC1/StrS family aminotransferase n=1 Tax=Vibrio penaeicida TaxID=104609 RepID=UPI002732EE5E|nr:DegT/DnrJ/EryC1/StrS family aminotransferase [Vibrio penaeicida]MDP2574901.1 DegT/DnrJ/EryC1/StrS family aminotransferase [Vibrio penaeicida]